MASPINPAYGHIFQQSSPSGAVSSLRTCLSQREWAQAQAVNSPLAGLNGHSCANGFVAVGGIFRAGSGLSGVSSGSSEGSMVQDLDVDFSRMGLTRKSKALKLISPTTNAPIRPLSRDEVKPTLEAPAKKANKGEEATSGQASRLQNGACPEVTESNSAKTVALSQPGCTLPTRVPKIKLAASQACSELCSSDPVSPTSGLPIGCKLRRWMVSPRTDGSGADSMDCCSDLAEHGENGTFCALQSPGGKSESTVVCLGQKLCDGPGDDGNDIDNDAIEGCSSFGASQSTDVVDGGDWDGPHRLDGLNDGMDVSETEGIAVVTNNPRIDAALGRNGVHNLPPGIPRNSRLRMWMARSG